MITRRTFLAGAAAGALILPELLIPKRTIFLPPAGGWSIHDIVTETLRKYAGQLAENITTHNTLYRYANRGETTLFLPKDVPIGTSYTFVNEGPGPLRILQGTTLKGPGICSVVKVGERNWKSFSSQDGAVNRGRLNAPA